ncbi:MAG: LytR/AlgR family response regulator transcription factor [Ekhidna sp.]
MDSIKIFIVEDDSLIAEDIKMMLEDLGYKVVGKAFNAESALTRIKTSCPDLILLDIELAGEMSGIDLAEIINLKHQIPFIYLTSYYDDATLEKVKSTSPAGYILKPFDENDLKVSIELALNKETKENDPEKIFIRVGSKLVSINTDKLCYVQSDDNYCILHMNDRKYTAHQTLKELLKLIQNLGFQQCHRSYLINFNKITHISEDYAFINDNQIPIGKTYRKDFLKQLNIV